MQIPELEQGIFVKAGSIVVEKMLEDYPKSVLSILADPFAIVIYLNSSFQAKGEVYWDDGASFDYDQYSEKTLVQFSFDGEILRSKSLLKDGFLEQASTLLVDEIIFAGFTKVPTKVMRYTETDKWSPDQQQIPLYFDYDANNTVLFIRQVSIPLDEGDYSSNSCGTPLIKIIY